MSAFPRDLLRLLPALLIAAPLATACDRSGSNAPPSVPQGEPLAIPFVAELGGQPATCASETSPHITDLRFFVSEIEVHSGAHGWIPAPLETVETWQNADVALVDLEDASGHCVGDAGSHSTLRARAQSLDIDGLRFVVGVPFAVNHADPAEAAPPLDNTAMHWTWNAGYRFVRLDATSDAGTYRAHLGSTNCQGTVGDISGCDHPNRARIVVDGWSPGQTVVLSLDRLLDGAPFTTGSAGCMGANDDDECIPIYRNLGIDPETGVGSPTSDLFVAR